MRGIDTQVRKTRRVIFREVAKLAYNSENLLEDVEALPYRLTNKESELEWSNVYVEREILRERIRLAFGLSLRPEDEPVSVSKGIESSDIAQKYYEPPLLQVIASACNACPENQYEVTGCMGCHAHPCTEVCPKGAISIVDGHSFIDQEKCIKCGKCKAICPYDAITHHERPCLAHCGVRAIESDESGKAVINADKCVSCGQCMVNCPFGAIADKSQIFQLIRAIQEGGKVIAQAAPAFVGQFGSNVTPDMLKTALKQIGFYDVYETAIGADMGAIAEAEHYVHEIASGKQSFLLTSCCPAWSKLAKSYFPETIDKISNALTPMVATARVIKKEYPDAKIVFIGPCSAKKLEASRKSVRSDVDFVITFEELQGIFDANDIDFSKMEIKDTLADATAAGRGYGVAGGVSNAIENVIRRDYPDVPVKIEHAEGLNDCKKALLLAKANKKDGCLIEGMACPGGCIAGAGTIIDVNAAAKQVAMLQNATAAKLPTTDMIPTISEPEVKPNTRFIKKLEETVDSLTGALDQVSFEARIKRLNELEIFPTATMFVSFAEGKAVDDSAIKALYESLREVALEVNIGNAIIGRIGNEVFNVVIPIVEETDVLAYIAQMQKESPGTVIGYTMKTNIEQNLAEVLKEAEFEMYEKKYH